MVSNVNHLLGGVLLTITQPLLYHLKSKSSPPSSSSSILHAVEAEGGESTASGEAKGRCIEAQGLGRRRGVTHGQGRIFSRCLAWH